MVKDGGAERRTFLARIGAVSSSLVLGGCLGGEDGRDGKKETGSGDGDESDGENEYETDKETPETTEQEYTGAGVTVDPLHGVAEVNDMGEADRVEIDHEKGFCVAEREGFVDGCVIEGSFEVVSVTEGERTVVQAGNAGTAGDASEDGLVSMDITVPGVEGFYAGTKVPFLVAVFGQEPITDAAVKARIEKPDGTAEKLWLEGVSDGFYAGTFEMDETSGGYEAVVSVTADDGSVALFDEASWNAENAPPVSVIQNEVPETESGGEKETSVAIEPEALLGIRSFEVASGNVVSTEEGERLSLDAVRIDGDLSHTVQDEAVEIDVVVDVPDDAAPGEYTSDFWVQMDSDRHVFEEFRFRVAG